VSLGISQTLCKVTILECLVDMQVRNSASDSSSLEFVRYINFVIIIIIIIIITCHGHDAATANFFFAKQKQDHPKFHITNTRITNQRGIFMTPH